jgi:hypothetical protein
LAAIYPVKRYRDRFHQQALPSLGALGSSLDFDDFPNFPLPRLLKGMIQQLWTRRV